MHGTFMAENMNFYKHLKVNIKGMSALYIIILPI